MNHIDNLLADPNWNWRYESFKGSSDAENQAAILLREKAILARNWLLGTSTAMGMTLPRGNGTNDHWNRIAVSDGSRFGILDIARGVLFITDEALPDFVKMFLLVGSASSHNNAGGSGSLPSGWGQIALVLHGSSTPVESSAKIVERVWGFRTCYGTTGGAPTPEAGVLDAETDLPQWEDVKDPMEVDPEAWERLMGVSEDVLLRPGYCSVGGVKLHTVSVFGPPKHRASRIAELSAKWETLASEEANRILIGSDPNTDFAPLLAQVANRRRMLGLRHFPLLPSGRSGRGDRFDNVYAIRFALKFLGLEGIAPPDPATPEHKAEVERIVKAMLAIHPGAMAQKLRDPSEANRAGYLIKHALPNERRVYTYDYDVEDDPRIVAYVAEVRQLLQGV